MMDWTLFFAALAAVISILNFLFLVFLDSLYPVLKEEDDEAGTDAADTQQSTNEKLIASSPRMPMFSHRSRRFTDKSKDWLDAHSAESRR